MVRVDTILSRHWCVRTLFLPDVWVWYPGTPSRRSPGLPKPMLLRIYNPWGAAKGCLSFGRGPQWLFGRWQPIFSFMVQFFTSFISATRTYVWVPKCFNFVAILFLKTMFGVQLNLLIHIFCFSPNLCLIPLWRSVDTTEKYWTSATHRDNSLPDCIITA